MVAAGGGGSLYKTQDGVYWPNCSGTGGSGGGLIGYQGTVASVLFSNPTFSLRYNTGGTQIDGGRIGNCIFECPSNFTTYVGTFGKGGRNYLSNGSPVYTSGSGGGGYWGGTGSADGITNQTDKNNHLGEGHTSGAGGSSYISGHQGSVAITSSTDRTPKCTVTETDYTPASKDYQNINETCSEHYSGLKFIDTVMVDGEGYSWTSVREDTPSSKMPDYKNEGKYFETGNTESGHAKISFLGKETETVKTVWQKNQEDTNPGLTPTIERDKEKNKDKSTVVVENLTADYMCGAVLKIQLDKKLENVKDVKIEPEIAKYTFENRIITVNFSETLKPGDKFTITYTSDENDIKTDAISLDPILTYNPGIDEKCSSTGNKIELTGHAQVLVPVVVPDTGLFLNVGLIIVGLFILVVGFVFIKKSRKTNI